MYELIYSPIVQEKLEALKMKLIEMCGDQKGRDRFRKVLDDFEIRLEISNTGIPIKTLYHVEQEYEKYYVIYSNKNYFLYYVEDKKAYVMEMYDEREDYAGDMFGIITTTQEGLDYWGEE